MQALFLQPVALAKLAGFLREVFKHKEPRPKAMVVVGPQDPRHNCLVVATVDQPSSHELQVGGFWGFDSVSVESEVLSPDGHQSCLMALLLHGRVVKLVCMPDGCETAPSDVLSQPMSSSS